MEDNIKEFSERMLERARKRQELIASVKPNESSVIFPSLHPDVLVPSEVSDVSTPSDLSTLSDLSNPSEPLSPSEQVPIPVLTQPSMSNLTKCNLPANTTYRDYQKSRLAELTQRVDMWQTEEPNYTSSQNSNMSCQDKSEIVSDPNPSDDDNATEPTYASSDDSDMSDPTTSTEVLKDIHEVYDFGDTKYILIAGGYPNFGLLKRDVLDKCPRYSCYNVCGINYVVEVGALPETLFMDYEEMVKVLVEKKILLSTDVKYAKQVDDTPTSDPSTEENIIRTPRRRMYPSFTPCSSTEVRFDDVPTYYPSTSRGTKNPRVYANEELTPIIRIKKTGYGFEDKPFSYPSTVGGFDEPEITDVNKDSSPSTSKQEDKKRKRRKRKHRKIRFPNLKIESAYRRPQTIDDDDDADDFYDDDDAEFNALYRRLAPQVSELVLKFQSNYNKTNLHKFKSYGLYNTPTAPGAFSNATMTKSSPVVNSPASTSGTAVTNNSPASTSGTAVTNNFPASTSGRAVTNNSPASTSGRAVTNNSPASTSGRAVTNNSPASTSGTAVTNNSPASTSGTAVTNNSPASTSGTAVTNNSPAATDNANASAITSTTTIANNENRTCTPKVYSEYPLSKSVIRYFSEPSNFGRSPLNMNKLTPPRIKNVLLKNQSVDDLIDEPSQIPNDTTGNTVVTSSPLLTSIGSPADRIAMAEGHVKILPPSPASGLYPTIEVENNINKTISTSSENQLSNFKRRSDGSSTMDTSTKSFESLSEDYHLDENIVVKRSRGEPKDTDMEVELKENSGVMTPGTSPLLSDHDRTMSQSSNSFTFHRPSETYEKSRQNDENLKRMSCYDFVDCEDSQNIDEFGKTRPPPLVHTISTYRKQQQRRLASSKNSERNSLRNQVVTPQLPPVKDDDEDEVQALEIAAERVRILESTIKEQDRIMNQATQALNVSELYRQKDSQFFKSSEYSTEHLHAERLMLIANLKRKDAVMESQRLRLEHTLCPGFDRLFLKAQDEGKKLVIESLRVPILSAVTGVMNLTKSKANCVSGNLTKWPLEYRYFVCVVRASSTVHRPPIVTATRPVDAVNESIYRFTLDDPPRPYNELGYGYVEFINRKNTLSSAGRKCPDAEGAPIIITGLDDSDWKITVELYGLYPIVTKESGRSVSSSGSSKEHNEKSVLDKFWSSVTPSKESKKPTMVPSIESPGGSSAVRNTMFRQLGYFVFSSGQVNRCQFTLNKIYQSLGSTKTSKNATEDVVRVCMQMLEPGEQYVSKPDQASEDGQILSTSVHEEMLVIKPLTLPSECKLEGFLTLFDDFALRPIIALKPNETPKWQHFLINNVETYKALWTRYWFRVEIIDDPNQELINKNVRSLQIPNTEGGTTNIRQQTIVLRYWQYPEHAEKEQEPVGIIDLSGCLSLIEGIITGRPNRNDVVPAAHAISDVCTRPNTLRVMFTRSVEDESTIDDQNSSGNDPLLLGADTPNELNEWCTTINAAVHAIITHQEQFKLLEKVPPTEKMFGTTKPTASLV